MEPAVGKAVDHEHDDAACRVGVQLLKRQGA
jgi:hypothetical protein